MMGKLLNGGYEPTISGERGEHIFNRKKEDPSKAQ